MYCYDEGQVVQTFDFGSERSIPIGLAVALDRVTVAHEGRCSTFDISSKVLLSSKEVPGGVLTLCGNLVGTATGLRLLPNLEEINLRNAKGSLNEIR